MNAPDVKLTLGLLVEITKCTFRGFKRTYRAQHDTAAKKRLDDNGRFSRWLSRRRQVRTIDMCVVFLQALTSIP